MYKQKKRRIKIMTKVEYYEAIMKQLEDQELINFCQKEINSIAKKAESSKVRREAKRAEMDELKEAVKAVLSYEPQTISEILNNLNDKEATNSKVVNRLSALVKEGIATKEEVTKNKRKLMTYKLAE